MILSRCNYKSSIFISEYNQTYHTHTSCYFCLDLTLCYDDRLKGNDTFIVLIFQITKSCTRVTPGRIDLFTTWARARDNFQTC